MVFLIIFLIKYIMIKVLMGILICSYSLMFWIIYLNIIVIDESILNYFIYTFTHVHTLMIFLGILLIYCGLKK